MRYTILDCYTDEASGLGVPPYLGTYPRYIYGKLKAEGHDVTYITIDDVRLWKKYQGVKKEPSVKQKTNILVYNTTNNDAEKVLLSTDNLIVVLGVHVPGKYLSAMPGTLKEVISLLRDVTVSKTLTGPAVMGTQLEGGKFFEKVDLDFFDEVQDFAMSFDEVGKVSVKSASILQQIPDKRVIEIETSRGCKVGKCSFCTEPLKNCFVNRSKKSVVEEVVAFYKAGARHFRIGKQADFYSSDDPVGMLKDIRKKCPKIEVLHIDNVNPNSVISKNGEEITQAIVKYCTPGNIAALGVESFDPIVVKSNLLNTSPAVALRAINMINKYGGVRGENGMHAFLPGINIIFGLIDESKQTHVANMDALKNVFDSGLLLRRINVRQAAVLPGTLLEKKAGNKFVRKNKKYYWKWRNDIRQTIDFPMLQKIVPVGTVLKDVYTEIYDGKTTFCRQMGTYPLIIGVKGRLPLKEKISVRVVDHMLRSIVGEVVE
ncbi:radical SAM protein [Candidatus Woesearchaeota archaeon]|jgi:radical SAM superfamily enzyme with C-terminal helix-hairpin-helix motif|nr:radical SAM protein [Candidatus Woesearchaeota archaeon]MBT5397473.1 radical SAM protein [Candidatus Woesearchaeota archaeon]MBT5924628.1 radical SAM protein [Candidatus Woesearchaeota archaeon]MBT6367954.1 radical SAM protein [Candidatus Woesearchaeota archaeon]MBT7763178.1 radical SAM protein [Candidatus Woesearchaeota archaeon]